MEDNVISVEAVIIFALVTIILIYFMYELSSGSVRLELLGF
uniref:Uncharacterized protein n=1 Tax=viral metagenome TaxID=1070528 RepID=A0A6M3IP81_9ZZZZ